MTTAYDIALKDNETGVLKMEIGRQANLLTRLERLSALSFAARLFGYSGVSLDKTYKTALQIFITRSNHHNREALITLEADTFAHLRLQLDLFKDHQQFLELTPISLVMDTLRQAIDPEDDNQDSLLLKEVLSFRQLLESETETLTISNRGTTAPIQISRATLSTIQQKINQAPEPTMVNVGGMVDELKFTKSAATLVTTNGEKILLKLKPEQVIELNQHFTKTVTIKGIGHYKTNGLLSHIEVSSIGTNQLLAKHINRRPDSLTAKQQIQLQLAKGKQANSIDHLFGVWDGPETDEELEKMIKELK